MLGHVDGVGAIVERRQDGGSVRLTVEAPAELARFIAPKGSIAIDGVSMTVNEVSGNRFGVNVIPITQRETNLGALSHGHAGEPGNRHDGAIRCAPDGEGRRMNKLSQRAVEWRTVPTS